MRYAWLRFGKSHYNVLFTIKPAAFLGLNLHQVCSLRYDVTVKRCKDFKGSFSNARISCTKSLKLLLYQRPLVECGSAGLL